MNDRKTDAAHWDAAYAAPICHRLPSRLNVDVLNVTRLLARHVRPGCSYLEIGCAPGKILAWVSCVLRAQAVGLDYSESGAQRCRELFEALGLRIDVHCADLFDHRLTPGSFDVVASFGLIEHFDDSRPAVRRHLDLLRPGGTALIGVPNYGGLYGALQRRWNPENLAIHNLAIMSPSALEALVDPGAAESATVYPFGSLSPSLVSLDHAVPRVVARIVSLAVNGLGLLQPVPIRCLAPMLVLDIVKARIP